MSPTTDMVTGAFSYTGRSIAEQLQAGGRTVCTLTRRPAPAGSNIEAFPFNFDRPAELRRSLEGIDTVYNTYWVRFERGPVEFSKAVANTFALIEAARDAGVRRFVHVSITNPDPESPLPYFKGKALIEQALVASGLSYAIVRPTVVFGRGDVFINNIAWMLRRFPVFAVADDGRYPIQPVHVNDLARICIEAGQAERNLITDAAGPEIFTFEQFVRAIGRGIGRNRPILHVPVPVFLAMGRLIGLAVRDVVVNRQELDGLMAGLVASSQAPKGRVSLSNWVADHRAELGVFYASEIGRNFERAQPGNSIDETPLPVRS